MSVHPGPCPTCGERWQSYGPYGKHECRNEHVFDFRADGDLVAIEYPDFTDQQIRDAEVELYRTGRVDSVPDRRAALRLLRREHEEERDLGWQPVRTGEGK